MSQSGLSSVTSSGGVTTLRTDDANLVIPAAGVIDVDGVVVANATNATPLFTDGATANTAIWELQVGAAITGAPADSNDAGIVSFDDTFFSVDANGFVAVTTPITVALGGTGTTSFTAGSVVFSNGSILTEDNSNLFWDDTNNRLGIGTTTPLDSLHLVGNMDLVHTATEADDHALEIDCDAAGFGDVKALDINYITGAMTAVQDEECILLNIDESASGGGIVNGYEVLTTTEGSATVNGYTTGIGVNPVVHESGTFGDADNILNLAADVTAALASGGAGGITIFVADNDTVTVGDAASWDEFEIILATGASGAGVAPTFEYSTGGAAYSFFSPADGTNGFRNTGAILWDSSALAGWATATSGDFEIRITRTRNNVSTSPIIDELQISSTTEYSWNKDGDVTINSLTLTTDLAITHGGTGTSNFSRLRPGYVENLGIDYNGGTGVFTVQGGAATLSATNSAFVTLPSKADPGELVLYEITADQSFIDDVGTSEIIGNLFGLTTSIAYATDIPFYIYAVSNNAESAIAFMISRIPHRTSAPATAAIGAPDDAVADDQGDFWSIDNIDETLYDTNPCVCIGSFRMQMSTSDDWTVSTLDNADGIGNFQEGRTFVFPLNQMGAASGTHLRPNSGTAPQFSTTYYEYHIEKTGFVSCQFDFDGDGGDAGVGAVVILITVPYVQFDEGQNLPVGSGYTIYSNGGTVAGVNYVFVSANSGALRANATTATFINLTNGIYTDTARSIAGNANYYISIT